MSIDIVNEIRTMSKDGHSLHDIIITIHEHLNYEPYQRGVVMIPLYQALGVELRALMDHVLSCRIFGAGTTSVEEMEAWFALWRQRL